MLIIPYVRPRLSLGFSSNSLLDDDRRPRPQDLAHLVEAHVEDEVGVGEGAGLHHSPAQRAEPLPHLVGAHHADRLGLLAKGDGALRKWHEEAQRSPVKKCYICYRTGRRASWRHRVPQTCKIN